MIDRFVILKFLKFSVVGFSGMLIDFGVTWLLKEKARANKYIANSTGFILAATSNYIWNRIWTFGSKSEEIAIEYFSFILISVAGLGINNLVIYLLHDRLGMNFYLSKLIAIGIVTVWNFTMNLIFTFR
ncbi:MAG TPA: GtrA family protein [Bacteroidales bacterium]|jgi:putative flippase GtrA|nr:GtrA family protein [Bacteroidales bacterium]HOS71227.1 GtrA family protein [Bacteroidales bacterium]HQH24345.1 GtrA family protein [Bacteroidales bacterium]HQJ81580.1 GtrA family protein [Bacteroidales bacterium]